MSADETQLKLPITEEAFFEPIDALHRKEDSVIGVLRKNSTRKSGVEMLFSATRAELRAMLPEVAQWLLKDAFFTINGYKSKAPYIVSTTGLPGVWRKEKNLRYLNAVYADLDVGRADGEGEKGQTVSEASMVLTDLLTSRTIPQISISAQSGRGMYVLWLLRDDEDADAPVTFKGHRSFAESKILYKKINRAIQERLQLLAADRLCDAARVFRTPGTLHSASGEECFYKVTYDSRGQLVTYTLNELAEKFGVPVLQSTTPYELREWEPNAEPVNPTKANGPKALAAARARDMVELEHWRGGWRKGSRRFNIRLYAQFLHASGISIPIAREALESMAKNCQPPYPSDDSDEPIKGIIGGVWSKGFATPRRENIVKWLSVSAEEARDLELEKIVPDEVLEERQPPKGGVRALVAKQRRVMIEKIIDEYGMLGERDFVTTLGEYGFHVGRSTVSRDLAKLGYQGSEQRKKAGRPPKFPGQMPLLTQGE